jgi:hypothetical protein
MKKQVNVLLLLVSLYLIPTFVTAQRYWIATTAGNWSDPNNWSGNILPAATDQVIFDGASGANGNCTLTAAVTIGSLTISGYSGTIDLGSNSMSVSLGSGISIFSTATISGSGSLTITHNTTGSVTFSGTTFNVPVTSTSEDVYLNGSTFNAVSSFTKDGTAATHSDNLSDGGNTFNATTTISCPDCNGLWTGTASTDIFLAMGNVSRDIFNGDLNITSTLTSGEILVAHNSIGNQFNGNIIITSIRFVRFGQGSTTATSTLADGKIISTPSGWTSGQLSLSGFTQVGSTAQSFIFSTTGTSNLRMSNCVFNGNISYKGVSLAISSGTFNGSCSFDFGYNGGVPTISNNPTFNGSATIIYNKSTAGSFAWEQSAFNGNFSHTQAGSTAILRFGNTATPCTFGGNIFTNTASSQIIHATFGGSATQTLSKQSSTATPAFSTFILNKTGGSVDLNYPLTVSAINFLASKGGIINTTTANYLDITSWTGTADNDSHVVGPIRKTGTAAFTFPTGSGAVYRPIAISAPASSTNYEATYFSGSARTAVGTTLGTGLAAVSDCEYWTLSQVSGSGNVNVTLSWGLPNSANCSITTLADLRVGQWDGTQWLNKGNGGTTGNGTAGTLTSGSGTITTYASPNNTFAVASSTLNNTLPIELIDFYATKKGNGILLTWRTASEKNNEKFIVEHSSKELEFKNIGMQPGHGNSRSLVHYEFLDMNPGEGLNYYRLRQVDYDEKFTISSLVSVNFEYGEISIYPNPGTRGEIIHTNYEGKATILNELGTIFQTLQDATAIDSTLLAPGFYIIQFDNGKSLNLLIR